LAHLIYYFPELFLLVYYILKFKLYSNAKRIKLADLEDNIMNLEEGSLKDKYRMAKWILTEG
jgi:hypothetical protein